MGVLFVSDNSGVGCANWVLRAITGDIAEELHTQGFRALADWLVSDDSPVLLYGHLDVRTLTPENQTAFRAAIEPAFRRSNSRSPINWQDRTYSHWNGYIDLFRNLVEQQRLIGDGDIPQKLPNLRRVPEHDGTMSGPGWKT